MENKLDWVVAGAIGILAGAAFLRAHLGLGVYVYVLPVLVLMGTAGIRVTVYRQRIPRIVALYAATWAVLVGWLLLSSLWSQPGIDAQGEAFLLTGILVTTLSALFSLTPSTLSKLVVVFIAVSAMVAGFVVIGYAQAGSLRGYGAIVAENYLVTARVLGLGTVAASLLLFVRRERPLYLWFLAFGLLVALAGALARGALLSTLGILLLSGLFLSTRMTVRRQTVWTWLASRLKKISLGLGVFALISAVVIAALQVERTAQRLRRMLSGTELQTGGRGSLWMTSIENIIDAPVFGYGLGSSGIMAGGHEEYYPHNLLLQVWLEGGVVALVLLLALIVFPFALALWRLAQGRLASSNRWIIYLGLFLFLVLEYSKSIDFYSGRLLAVLGIVAVWAVWLYAQPESVGSPSRRIL
jgi:O-antigen ligase